MVGSEGVVELVVVGGRTIEVDEVDVVVGVGIVDDEVVVGSKSVVEEKPVGPVGRSGVVDVVDVGSGTGGKSPVGA